MCRHLAYLGPSVRLADVLLEPPHGLLRQSYAPRRQQHGTVNADGFGVGWYVDGDPVPARYRRDRPIWSDPNVVDLARVTRTRAVLAAVRSGTDGMGHAEGAAAPFQHGRWLFSHNGAVPGFPGSLTGLAAAVGVQALTTLDAPTDSALLWAFTRARLEGGDTLAEALRATIDAALSASGRAPTDARLNLLLTDGSTVAATIWGDTLCWRGGGPDPQIGVWIASEPLDDEPGWHDVPDRHLLTATPDGVHVTTLEIT